MFKMSLINTRKVIVNLAIIVVASACGVGCIKRDNYNPKKETPWNATSSLAYVQPLKIASNITYKKDKDDYWQTPYETRRLGTGDCEDIGNFLLDEWEKEGKEGRLVIGLTHKDSKIIHAWCEVMDKGEIYIADPVSNDFFPKKEAGIDKYIEIKGSAYIRSKKQELMQRIRRENEKLKSLPILGPGNK